MKHPVKNKDVYLRIRQILESARLTAARSVNTAQVMANWLVGREIVEEEQKGERRANYGEQLIAELSENLTRDYGSGYSIQSLKYIRQFYLTYSRLVGNTEIGHALRGQSTGREFEATEKVHALRGKSSVVGIPDALPRKSTAPSVSPGLEIGHALRGQSQEPGERDEPSISEAMRRKCQRHWIFHATR